MKNRVIKFRVWDIKEKSFYTKENHPRATLENGEEMYSTNVGFLFFSLEDIQDDTNFILQQYTGLKDKNNKEIYEGDILKFSNLNYRLFWNDSKWTAECPYYCKYHYPNFDLNRQQAKSVDIIGNIFETPELLSSK